jgi:hypothetical protein
MISKGRPVRIVIGMLLLCVPTLLAYAAVPRLLFGLQTEPAHRSVLSATSSESVSVESAQIAAKDFEGAPSDDGDDEAQAAEFLARTAGANRATLSQVRKEVIDALTHAPTNPRAWTLLCEIKTTEQMPARTVTCLDTVFSLVRYDWFTADRRMRLVAYEWPYLDQGVRDSAVQLILPMWNSTDWIDGSTLRGALYDLSLSENGRQLLKAGMISDRQALRDFNRFVIHERMDATQK